MSLENNKSEAYFSGPKFFGRRKGRVVRKAKQYLLDNLLPQMKISAAEDFADTRFWEMAIKERCLEIGFGDGQHLYGQAKKTPWRRFLSA